MSRPNGGTPGRTPGTPRLRRRVEDVLFSTATPPKGGGLTRNRPSSVSGTDKDGLTTKGQETFVALSGQINRDIITQITKKFFGKSTLRTKEELTKVVRILAGLILTEYYAHDSLAAIANNTGELLKSEDSVLSLEGGDYALALSEDGEGRLYEIARLVMVVSALLNEGEELSKDKVEEDCAKIDLNRLKIMSRSFDYDILRYEFMETTSEYSHNISQLESQLAAQEYITADADTRSREAESVTAALRVRVGTLEEQIVQKDAEIVAMATKLDQSSAEESTRRRHAKIEALEADSRDLKERYRGQMDGKIFGMHGLAEAYSHNFHSLSCDIEAWYGDDLDDSLSTKLCTAGEQAGVQVVVFKSVADFFVNIDVGSLRDKYSELQRKFPILKLADIASDRDIDSKVYYKTLESVMEALSDNIFDSAAKDLLRLTASKDEIIGDIRQLRQTKLAGLEKELTARGEELQQLNVEVEELAMVNRDLQDQLQKVPSRPTSTVLGSSEDENLAAIFAGADRDTSQQAFADEKAALAREREEFEVQRQALAAQQQYLAGEKAALAQERAELEAQRQHFEKYIKAQQQTLENEMSRLDRERERLNEEESALQALRDSIEQEREVMADELQRAKEAMQAQLQQEIEAMQAQLQKEIDAMQDQLQKEKDDMAAEIALLNDRKQRSDNAMRGAKEFIDELRRENEGLKTQNEDLQAQLDDLTRQHQSDLKRSKKQPSASPAIESELLLAVQKSVGEFFEGSRAADTVHLSKGSGGGARFDSKAAGGEIAIEAGRTQRFLKSVEGFTKKGGAASLNEMKAAITLARNLFKRTAGYDVEALNDIAKQPAKEFGKSAGKTEKKIKSELLAAEVAMVAEDIKKHFPITRGDTFYEQLEATRKRLFQPLGSGRAGSHGR